MPYTIQQSEEFSDWLHGLRDSRARASIARRINRMERDNFGDHHSIGDGVSEMRIDVGQGYRAYYVVRNSVVVILLCGGDKSSQQRDIARAKKMAKEV